MAMLEKEFVPYLLATNLPWNTKWFMQDGATPHTANALDFLHETFSYRMMSHCYSQRHHEGFFWPPLSPDLNPCDFFFLWGYLKEKLYPLRPQNLMEMHACIVQLCNEINEDFCRKVIRNMSTCLHETVRYPNWREIYFYKH